MDCETFRKLALAEWQEKKRAEEDEAKRLAENEYEAAWKYLKSRLPLLEKLPPNKFLLCDEEFSYTVQDHSAFTGDRMSKSYCLDSPFGSVKDVSSFGAFLESKAESSARIELWK